MNGVQEIAKERIRQQLPVGARANVVGTEVKGQITQGEGYDTDHDDAHIEKELIWDGALPLLQSYANGPGRYVPDDVSDHWGLGGKHNTDPRRALIIAGALIAAEIDRLDRAEAKKEGKR